MPIKVEDRHRYPPNWEDIRAQVLERAGHRCQWPGCGAPNHAIGFWLRDQFVVVGFGTIDPRAAVQLAWNGHRLLRIVLTVAHLDHTPEHCEMSNLRAWCQRHHLRYDLDHHRTNAYMTRKAKAATMDLFGDVSL
jgi:hypothetical protein